MNNFVCCKKIAFGNECNKNEFRGYDAVYNQMKWIREKGAAVLNYSDKDVENALHCMGGGQEHAAGFSQSQHNYNKWPCDDNITFDWDKSARQAAAEGISAYAETMPYTKDFKTAVEGCSAGTQKWALSQLDTLTNAVNKKCKKEMGSAATKGSVMSAKLPLNATRPRNQNDYSGRC
jgi:hypothetical protein